MITRQVSRDTLDGWGIPYPSGADQEARILDVQSRGSEAFADYKKMIFIAPDDGHAYSVNYARGLAVSEIFMEHDEFVTLVRVRSETRPITITEWFPVTQAYLDGPPVPTLDQLKARWDANRADDAAEAEDAGW